MFVIIFNNKQVWTKWEVHYITIKGRTIIKMVINLYCLVNLSCWWLPIWVGIYFSLFRVIIYWWVGWVFPCCHIFIVKYTNNGTDLVYFRNDPNNLRMGWNRPIIISNLHSVELDWVESWSISLLSTLHLKLFWLNIKKI